MTTLRAATAALATLASAPASSKCPLWHHNVSSSATPKRERKSSYSGWFLISQLPVLLWRGLSRAIWVNNFEQTATAKKRRRVLGRWGTRGCSCRKQISSGSMLKRLSFRPATPKPTRTSKVCLSLRGSGRTRRYKSESPLVDHESYCDVGGRTFPPSEVSHVCV